MAKRAITHAVGIAALSLALMGASCQPQPSAGPDEFRIALREIKTEHLAKCQGLGEAPENSTGDLLQDFANLASVSATCRAKHNTLIDYLAPVVEKAKQAQ